MSPELVQLITTRARGCCEACGISLARAGRELDHFFSRGRSEEAADTVWVLCPRCHFKKTRNVPSAAHWLRLYIVHCETFGYEAAKQRAAARLFFVDSRAALPVPP